MPFNSLQPCCSPACAIAKMEKDKQSAERKNKALLAQKRKIERQAHRAAKEKIKTLSEILQDAQKYCNRYIRLKHKGEPCYTCGQYRDNYEAGHFIPVGKGSHWHLRFHHFNIRPQCHRCNNYEGGRPREFKAHLILDLGIEAVEYLENAPVSSFTKEDAYEIKAYFMEECKRLTKERRC